MSPKPNQTIHNTTSKFFQITGIILEIRNGSNFYLALVTRGLQRGLEPREKINIVRSN